MNILRQPLSIGLAARKSQPTMRDLRFSKVQWIGFLGKIYRKPSIFPLNMGLSCKFSLKPIHSKVHIWGLSGPWGPQKAQKLPRSAGFFSRLLQELAKLVSQMRLMA
jgi:hypothetical protein